MQTKTPYIPTREQKSAVPLGDFDVLEDGKFSCSFFYEENTFCKDANGDLILVHSEYGIDDPLESE